MIALRVGVDMQNTNNMQSAATPTQGDASGAGEACGGGEGSPFVKGFVDGLALAGAVVVLPVMSVWFALRAPWHRDGLQRCRDLFALMRDNGDVLHTLILLAAAHSILRKSKPQTFAFDDADGRQVRYMRVDDIGRGEPK